MKIVIQKLFIAALTAFLVLSAPVRLFAQTGAEQAVPAPQENVKPAAGFENGRFSLRFGIEAQTQGVLGGNAFWGLAQTYAPHERYPHFFYWAEGYVKPGLNASFKAADWVTFYGSVSLTASGTLGDDYFMYGTAGTVQISEAALGVRFSDKKSSFFADISAGKQPFSIGSGFIIYNGGANGFERGALLLSPYRSWANTAILSLGFSNFTLRGFYIENEVLPGQSPDKIAGTLFEWKPAGESYLGLAYLQVFESALPYPKLTVGSFIENGRRGLNVFDLYWQYKPTEGALTGFWFKGEAVLQFKTSIDMLAYGTGVEAGYRFLKVPFAPAISYLLSYTSGAQAGSSVYSRFDGLFWNSSPSGWAAGGNASMSFLNSNLFYQRIKIDAAFSPRDLFSVSYYHVMAAQLQSPLQFGQAARYDSTIGKLILGVGNPSLSYDLYLEYTHIFTDNLFLIGGFAVSFPGAGLVEIIDSPSVWPGGFISFMVKY